MGSLLDRRSNGSRVRVTDFSLCAITEARTGRTRVILPIIRGGINGDVVDWAKLEDKERQKIVKLMKPSWRGVWRIVE